MMNISREELLVKYEEYLKSLGKSQQTIRSYKNAYNRFVRDTDFELEDMIDITQSWCLDYANSLREEISVATINKHTKQLSSFYQFLNVKGYTNINPFFRLPSLSNCDSEYKDKVMTNEQVKALLKASDTFEEEDWRNGLRDKTMMYLLMNIGTRIGELSRVRVEDIDLENKKIFIRGKGHNDNVSRFSNFNDTTKELIERLIAKKPNREYLFTNYKGEQLNEQTIRKVWYKCCEIANVEGFTPHSVRHMIGSTLVAKGVDLKKVAFVLGHNSWKTTERYYVRPKESMADILDNMADIFE